MEILSPVKNLIGAKGVVQAGADAIFLASPSFGARVNASIKREEIIQIVNYCKDYNVKTYFTFNTVVLNNEIDDFFDELDFIYLNNADGIILQDYSLISIIKKRYQDLEIHCSTQMHIHNTDATNFVKMLGSNRIVVPREMNYKRIKVIKENTKIEIESFIHGALCVSYSGQCYDSTLLDQKSANRGRCSQYCRMPQKIYNKKTDKVISKGNYPLSLKDLNNLDNVEQYINAGVDSLKIEGRLKELSYATYVTKLYKDKLSNKKVDSKELKKVYNRDFTSGRINSINGSLLVNQDKQNNNGRLIGEVVDIKDNWNKNLGYYKYIIEVKSNDQIVLKDNIRFLSNEFESGQLVEQIEFSSNYYIYSNDNPHLGCKVYKTSDFVLKEKMQKLAQEYNHKRIVEIDIVVCDSMMAIYDNKVIDIDCNLEYAINKPTSKEDILDILNTKNSPFKFKVNNFEYEQNLFIANKFIKQLKKELILEIRKTGSRVINDIKPEFNIFEKQNIINNFVEVRTVEQYELLKDCKNTTIMISDPVTALEINPSCNDYFVVPRVIYDDERHEIDKIIDMYDNLCISELGSMIRYKDKKLISNFTFNTTNVLNQEFLISNDVDKTILSIELNFNNFIQFANKHSIVNVYGRVPVMLMDYCPINLNKKDKCGSCRLCHNGDYYLKDNYDREFPLLYEGDGRISMYSKQHINLTSQISKLADVGITNFHFRLTDEKENEVKDLQNFLNNGKILMKEEYLGNFNKQIL